MKNIIALVKCSILYLKAGKLTFELKVTYFGVHMSGFVKLALIVEFSSGTVQEI